jgi:hypothetical protein
MKVKTEAQAGMAPPLNGSIHTPQLLELTKYGTLKKSVYASKKGTFSLDWGAVPRSKVAVRHQTGRYDTRTMHRQT